MSAPEAGSVRPPSPAPYGESRSISWGWRTVGAGVLFIALEIVYVGLPLAAIRAVVALGLDLVEPSTVIVVFGSACALLGAGSYLARPTRVYGPILLAAALAAIAYLLALVPYADFTVALGSASARLGFAGLLELLIVLPAIGAVRAVLILIQDLRDHPARRAVEFPAR